MNPEIARALLSYLATFSIILAGFTLIISGFSPKAKSWVGRFLLAALVLIATATLVTPAWLP